MLMTIRKNIESRSVVRLKPPPGKGIASFNSEILLPAERTLNDQPVVKITPPASNKSVKEYFKFLGTKKISIERDNMITNIKELVIFISRASKILNAKVKN